MIRAWLQILRLPNLLTVPGDPVAGFILVSGTAAVFDARIAFVALSSLFLYAGGLLVNDALDSEVDARERPERPIPSGRLEWNTVFWTGNGLLWGAVMASFFMSPGAGLMAAGLSALIYLYNGFLKKHRFWGPVALGCCRGGSMLMGASLVGCNSTVLVGAIFYGVYVWAVSMVARTEMQDHADRRMGWMVLCSALLLAALDLQLVIKNSAPNLLWVAMMASLFCALAGMGAWTLRGCPPGVVRKRQVPFVIGLWLSMLPLIQAAFVLAVGVPFWSRTLAIALLVAWGVNRLLARRFYAS